MLQIQSSFESIVSPTEFPEPSYMKLVGVHADPASMYDNRWLTGAFDCYESYKRITFDVERSRVHYVKLLSSENSVIGKFSTVSF